jgi:hypothetical protein
MLAMADAILRPEDWTVEDRRRARQIWEQYQQQHDLTERKGETAGIDPRSGEVWLGRSIIEISNQRREVGSVGALFFERIGYPAHTRKGRHPHRTGSGQ